MIDIIATYWELIVVAIIVIGVIATSIITFMAMPKDEQMKKIRERLLWWCILAEKALGSGTGEIKLRRVYNEFANNYPKVAEIITFEAFNGMVKEALKEMQELIEKYPEIRKFIYGD